MLLENFYKIIHRKEREDGKREIEIELNPGHALYQGHFPGQPVVPGVCTLQMIKESAEQIVNRPLQYVQIASSKFLSAINPLETPLLQLFIRLEETEEHLFKLQAEGICNGKEFIKLKATLMTNSKKTHLCDKYRIHLSPTYFVKILVSIRKADSSVKHS